MEVILKHINEHERELHINTPWKTIETDYNDLLKRYSKLPIKGFRLGKTPPRSAVESFYRSQIKNDLLIIVSTRLCRKALQEKEVIAGSPVEIMESQLKPYDSLQFKAAFIEMPAFELPDYLNLQLEATDPEEQLNEVSLKLLEQTDIVLPPLFVEDELKFTELSGETPTEEERLAAEERVRLMLILKKIGTQDSIEVQEKEIEERIKSIARDIESTPEELKEYLMGNNGWGRFTDTLLAEQVLQYIISTQNSAINS